MTPRCWLTQRALSRLAALDSDVPDGSRLAVHMLRCRACRAAWLDLTRVADVLDRSLESPTPSSGFAADVLARATSPSRPAPRLQPRLRPIPMAAGALGLIVLACYLPRLTAMFEGRNARRAPALVVGRPNASIRVAGIQPARPGSLPDKVEPVSAMHKKTGTPTNRTVRRTAVAPSHSRAMIRRHRHVYRRRIEIASGEAGAFQTVLSAAVRFSQSELARVEGAERWARFGAWCEARGDYPSAEEAYHRAYRDVPSAYTAFSAGRAAERAGDTVQALDFYSRLLDRSTDKGSGQKRPDPEKGSSRWSGDRGSA